MHENEFEINESIVRTLLKSQCPQWSDLSISPIKSSGTDNALFRFCRVKQFWLLVIVGYKSDHIFSKKSSIVTTP